MSGFGPPRPSTPPPPRITVQDANFKRRLVPWDFRAWFLAGMMRGGAAVGFAAVPALEASVGDVALALMCVLAAGGMASVAAYQWYTSRQPVRVEVVVDVITLLILMPALALAAGIRAADSRFGGRDENVVSAMIGALLIFMIVTVVGRALDGQRGRQLAIAIVPAALGVALVFGSGDRFASGAFWRGAALAWGIAAVTTIFYGLTGRSAGVVIITAVYAVVAGVSLLTRQTQTGFGDVANSTGWLSAAAILVVGAILVIAAFSTGGGRAPRRRVQPTEPIPHIPDPDWRSPQPDRDHMP